MANIETRQNCSMKDIINLFIEYDENVKIYSLTIKNTFESAKTLKKNGFNKNFQRNTIKCTYCNRIGHKTEECRIKFWNENKNKTASSSKISSNVQLFSPSTSTTSSSSSTTPKTSIKRVAKSVINKIIDNMSNIWILDSACTSHTTIQGDKLINPIYKEIEFEIASGDVVKSELVGDVIIKPTEETELFLKDVVYGNFNSNLISIRKLILDDYEIFFGKERALIKKDDIVIEAMLFQDLWIVTEMSKPKICNIWHKRLGHCCTKILSQINKVEPQINLKNEKCEDCCMNKSVSLPHKVKMVYDDIGVFEMLHIDLWQAPELSCGGSRYAMLIIDHFSCFCFGIPLKHKSDATNELIKFILKKEKCFKTKVKRLRTDQGGEFINETFKAFCSEKNIDHETTVGYSPEQNGIVERMNRTVFSTVRTLLNSANVPEKYWAETMATAIYLINSWIRDDELSPYEKMFNKKPNYRHQRTFGCVAYVHQNQMKRLSKLDETARKLMFIGYSGSIVNYVLLDPEIDEIIVTNDVKFNESKMFFEQISSSSNLSSSSISDFSSPFINDLNSQNVDLTSSNSADSFEETITNSVNEDDTKFNPEYTTESTETVDIVENSFPRRSSHQNLGIPPIHYGYKCIDSFVVSSTYEEALSLSDSEDWKKAIQNEIDNNLSVQQIIGSLLYLANRTRPDISFAVNWLSRFSINPTQSLFAACKMVLRYLSRTIEKKLIIGRLNSILSVYTDSSFGQGTSRHSTTGIIVGCGESTIKLKSVKQRKISISSCEAEITAILEGYRIAEFLLHIFNWLQYHIEIKFLCDNQSAIHLIKKSNSMKKSRYFDLEVKKLIELFSTNQLYNINYVPTKEQISDCLTKPLNEKLFLICIEKIFI